MPSDQEILDKQCCARLTDDDVNTVEEYPLFWWVWTIQPEPTVPARFQAVKAFWYARGSFRRVGALAEPRQTREEAVADGKASGLPKLTWEW
jgi:hypothetical protein